MARRMIIETSGHTLDAELSDSTVAQVVLESLPVEVEMSRWGEEYYGSVGIDIHEDGTQRELLEVGEIAYWRPGKALCIFFGRTPVSNDERPKAASPVMPIGRVIAVLNSLPGLGKRVRMTFRAV